MWRDPSAIIERHIKVIVTTPESAMVNQRIQEALLHLCRQKYILRYVFDEAHLIISWGNQFRPAYIQLINLLQRDSMRANVTLVSATINQQTQRDLEFLFKQCLAWNVFKGFKQFYSLMRFMTNENVINSSGIIYTYCKRTCYDLQLALQLNGILSLSYTTELSIHSKKNKQDVWMHGQIKIMIATSAFGMGIDKPDTKFVVIYELPDSMDTLVQMIGRAGRNGEKAYGLILYSFGDYQAVRGNINRTLTTRRKEGSSTLELRYLKLSMLRDFFDQIIFLENMDKCLHGMTMNYYYINCLPIICLDKCDNCEIRRTDQLQHIRNGYNLVADFIRDCHALSNSPI
ncbi:hypothetical protein TKK_0002850 [Trichogramma kaykai]